MTDTCKITTFFHCRKCVASKPPSESPASWARLAVGFTPDGLQVWCQRHDIEVVTFNANEAKDHGH